MNRIKIAIIALVAAMSALWLYAENLDDEHEALVADQVEVVKAARSIDAGVPLTKQLITTEKVPRKFLPPNPLLESELNIYLGTPLAANVEEGAMLLRHDFSYALRERPSTTLAVQLRSGPESAPTGPAVTPERLIIKTAKLALSVENPFLTSAELVSLAKSAGGYVSRSNAQEEYNGARVHMTLRVPAKKFEQLLNQYRSSGTLKSESIEGTDVTEQFIDLDAQARNTRALETRLLKFLEKAEDIDEAIKLEEKISKIRTDSDQLEGRADALRKQEALSTIDVTLSKTQPETKVVVQRDSWGPVKRALHRASETMIKSVAFIIGALSMLAPFLLFGGPIFFAWRRRRRTSN